MRGVAPDVFGSKRLKLQPGPVGRMTHGESNGKWSAAALHWVIAIAQKCIAAGSVDKGGQLHYRVIGWHNVEGMCRVLIRNIYNDATAKSALWSIP